MKSNKIVDFSKSNFSWLGESKGKFKIASVISITNETKTKNRYILTENGLAGNVYSKNNLIKTPSYLFQVIASKKYQKIFRTDLDSKFFDLSSKNFFRRNILDTEGNIFGDNLESVTKNSQFIPDTGTYSSRSFGGTECPGILLNSFSLTL